jgi:hypothetical protein
MSGLSAHACDFDPKNAQADVDKAEVIFTGGVSGVKHMANDKHDANQPEYKAIFNADKIYKGHADGAVNVVQMHDAWGQYINFNTGKEYLVLAGRNEFGVLIDGCSPVMSLDPSSARSDEPGPAYKQAIMQALKDESIFPSLAPIAEEKGVAPAAAKKVAKNEPASGEVKKEMKKAKEDLEDSDDADDNGSSATVDPKGDE